MITQVEQMHGADGYVGTIDRYHDPVVGPYRYTIHDASGQWAGGGIGLQSLDDAREALRDDLSALWLTGGRP